MKIPKDPTDSELLNWLCNDKYLISITATMGGWRFNRTTEEIEIHNGTLGLKDAMIKAYLEDFVDKL